MTAAELIALLQTIPPDAKVLVEHGSPVVGAFVYAARPPADDDDPGDERKIYAATPSRLQTVLERAQADGYTDMLVSLAH